LDGQPGEHRNGGEPRRFADQYHALSFWPYYARAHSPWPIPQDARIAAPTGYAQFPKEILRPPRSLAERTYANIQRWTEMKKGGHFAALEQPEALAREIREFFRPLR